MPENLGKTTTKDKFGKSLLLVTICSSKTPLLKLPHVKSTVKEKRKINMMNDNNNNNNNNNNNFQYMILHSLNVHLYMMK